MNWETIAVCILVLGALISFISEKIPVDLTAMGVFSALLLAAALSGSELLPSTTELIDVFANPAPLSIAAMFIISTALEKCGAIECLTSKLQDLVRLGYRGLLGILLITVTAASAFMNNTAIVVMLLPVVLTLSRHSKTPASKFLIPLSYASIFGGCCTAIGTSTNLLVSGILVEYGQKQLGMFELTAIGLPLAIVGIGYLVLFGNKVLPKRESLMSLLSEEEQKEYIIEVFVKKNSKLVGQTLKEAGLLEVFGIRVLEVIRSGVSLEIELNNVQLGAGDRIVLACHPTKVVKARSLGDEQFLAQLPEDLQAVATHKGSIVEGIIGPNSNLIGKTLREAQFRQRYHMVLLAVHRSGINMRKQLQQIRFKFGDTLLLVGAESSLEAARQDTDLLLLDKPALPAQNMRKKMPITLGILFGFVLVASLNLIPITAAALISVTCLFAFGCLRIKEGYQSIDWRILILIYGMLAIGLAMDKAGLVKMVAHNLVTLSDSMFSSDFRPYAILALLYICTGALTEVLSNNATAVLMAPIGIGLAHTLGLDPRPFVIATTIGASASFSTPIGYQTNTYVYGIGGYKFGDFWKVGLPLNILYGAGCVFLIPRIWSF